MSKKNGNSMLSLLLVVSFLSSMLMSLLISAPASALGFKGKEHMGSEFRFDLRGIVNMQFARTTLNLNAGVGTLEVESVNTNGNWVHVYYPTTYASINIEDEGRNSKFTKEWLGDKAEINRVEGTIAVKTNDLIIFHHKEANNANRLDLRNVTKGEAIQVPNSTGGNVVNLTTAYEITDLGLVQAYTIAQYFPDANYARIIAGILSKGVNDFVSTGQLARISEVDAENQGISNITGSEYLSRVTKLNLSKNQIEDVKPLQFLMNLDELNLDENQITDISPLTNANRIQKFSALNQSVRLPDIECGKGTSVGIYTWNGTAPTITFVNGRGTYGNNILTWRNVMLNRLTWNSPLFTGTLEQNVTSAKNANLMNLFVNSTPVNNFNENTLNYTVHMPYSTTIANVAYTLEDQNATAVVIGNGAPLQVGSNTITIEVTAQDTSIKKTYIVNIVRAGGADLVDLLVNDETVWGFDENTLNYTVFVPYATSVSDVTYLLSDPNATAVAIGNGVPLQLGDNFVTIEVTSENGKLTKTYRVKIVRASSLDLIDLHVNSVPVSGFDANILSYTVSVPYTTSVSDVTYELSDPNATVVVVGNGAPLQVGNNIVTIEVTSPDGSLKKMYAVTLIREKGTDTTPPIIDFINVSVGTATYSSVPGLQMTIEIEAYDEDSGIKELKLPDGRVVEVAKARQDKISATYEIGKDGVYEFRAEDNGKNYTLKKVTIVLGIITSIDTESGSGSGSNGSGGSGSGSNGSGGSGSGSNGSGGSGSGSNGSNVGNTVPSPEIAKITISPSSATVKKSEHIQFTAEGTFVDGTKRDITNEVTWSVGDPKIGTNVAGKVTGLAKGETNIMATMNGIEGKAVLKVTEDEHSHIAYINGYPDGTIRPNAPITRQEVAEILRKISEELGEKDLANKEISFKDVTSDMWSVEAILYASKAELFIGFPDGNFYPQKEMTRAEAAVLLNRLKEVNGGSSKKFLDIPIDHWAAVTVSNAGWMDGYSDGFFKPSQTITRAEFITAMNRLLNRKPDTEYINSKVQNSYSDISNKNWFYVDLIEATVSHRYESGEISETWMSHK